MPISIIGTRSSNSSSSTNNPPIESDDYLIYQVLKSLPRLERFVREICGFVFRREKGGYDEEGKPLTSDDIIRRWGE